MVLYFALSKFLVISRCDSQDLEMGGFLQLKMPIDSEKEKGSTKFGRRRYYRYMYERESGCSKQED